MSSPAWTPTDPAPGRVVPLVPRSACDPTFVADAELDADRSSVPGRHDALRWPAQHTHRRLGGILRLSGTLPAPAWNATGASDATTTVLIPAHNEQDALPAALASLRWQTSGPRRVIVVADNCTDDTVATARSLGADVFVTEGNRDKKAGALNQALATVLPQLRDDEFVLVMDADSMIVPKFLAVAARRLADDGRAGAVGGVFYGEPGGGLVGALQRNEYTRYAREIARRQGRAVVLTGTASLFRVPVLRAVAAGRGTTVPGRPGTVYDTQALTEDNEITLAVKTLGWATASPRSCGVLTEIMPTWSALWAQRLRWQRGAVENLRHYGLTRVTAPYLAKQATMYLGIVAVLLFLVATVLFGLLGWLAVPHGLWWALPALFVTERVWTVRRAGWAAMALAAPVVIEFGYDLFQQSIYLRAAVDSLLRRPASWHHANDPTAPPTAHPTARHRTGSTRGHAAPGWGPWPADAWGEPALPHTLAA